MSTSVFQNSRPSFWFGVFTAFIALASVAASVTLALLGHAYWGCLTLGGASITLGLARLLWPGKPWFASRNRWADSIVYLLAGGAIIALAPWVNALPA